MSLEPAPPPRPVTTALRVIGASHFAAAAVCEWIAHHVGRSPGDDNPVGLIAMFGLAFYLVLGLVALVLAERWSSPSALERAPAWRAAELGATAALALPAAVWLYFASIALWWWGHGPG